MSGKIFSDEEILERGRTLLEQCRVARAPFEASCAKIHSDGSTRRFGRLRLDEERGVVIVAPLGGTPAELAESRAAWKIGSHLHQRGVAVPELYGWDEESGTLCCEDLGDLRLHQVVEASSSEEQVHRYRQALRALVVLQLDGAAGFDPSWCWDTPRYDRQLMLERESGYFLRAFWHGLLGRETPAGFAEEGTAIADRAANADCSFFLHRDCQSRNLMVQGERLCFIDFQGGRLGPLGYDVASLLLSPYAGLHPTLQEQLLTEYLDLLEARLPGARAEVAASYPYLALQRNLQIVGAFAFLWKVRGKSFFSGYLRPALRSLATRLATPPAEDFPVLRAMARQGLAALKGLGV